MIINGGFDDRTATEALAHNEADAIVFGTPFIANPDLVARYRRGQVLNSPDSNTFYTPGETGYTDYPALVACLHINRRQHIMRDTRFSRDKKPYKTNVGCHFRHVAGKTAHAPGFYFHLQPGNVFVGAGIWKPDAPTLANIRNAIIEKPGKWEDTFSDRKLWQRFGDIQGERLKRAPRGYDSEHAHVEHLKLKSFFIHQPLNEALATSPELIDEVIAAYSDSIPLTGFLTRAVGLPF